MKFCYLDETGTGQDTVVITVGVIVDASRMHLTKSEWDKILKSIGSLTKKPIKELHTTELYSGNGEWRVVPPETRVEIVSQILDWFAERKHSVTFSAVDRQSFEKRKPTCAITSHLGESWHMTAFHNILSVQKLHQKLAKNKGHTVIVFDEGKGDATIRALFSSPPQWSDSYYSLAGKRHRLNQIVDTPYFADSRHVSMIQVADLIGFILRRYSDLIDYKQAERYEGELKRISDWIAKIRPVLIDKNFRYPKRGRCDTAEVFYQLAPVSLREL